MGALPSPEVRTIRPIDVELSESSYVSSSSECWKQTLRTVDSLCRPFLCIADPESRRTYLTGLGICHVFVETVGGNAALP